MSLNTILREATKNLLPECIDGYAKPTRVRTKLVKKEVIANDRNAQPIKQSSFINVYSFRVSY